MTTTNTLLPPNATELELAIEATVAERLAELGAPNKTVTNPNTCSANILPWLAWEEHVDRWDDNWLEETRRDLIASSLLIHKHKGTLGSLKQALAVFNLDEVLIQEWFEYDGEPYFFQVFITITSGGFDIGKVDDIAQLIYLSKNARSWLERLQIILSTTSDVPVIAGVCLSGEITTLYPIPIPILPSQVPMIAGACLLGEVSTVFPKAMSVLSTSVP